jgi:hypothetical protein
MWFGIGPLLGALAAPLAVEQSPGDARYMVLRGDERGPSGSHALDEAANFFRAAPTHQIVLIGRRPGRVVELGILPSFVAMSRRELASRGVPGSAMVVAGDTAMDEWDEARLLAAWLHDRPGVTVAFACSQFRSGKMRYVLDRVLSREDAARVRIFSLRAPDCDARSWWRSRSGVKEFMFSWLEMAYARWEGENRPVPQRLDADAYRKKLDRALARAPQ